MSTYKKKEKLTTKARKAHEKDLKPRNQVLCVPSCAFVRLGGSYSSRLLLLSGHLV
jgi:hypothetical protein